MTRTDSSEACINYADEDDQRVRMRAEERTPVRMGVSRTGSRDRYDNTLWLARGCWLEARAA